ncbi:hypothetical protein SAMN05444722_2145 [Rhodovulum sp. ES.010]|uniref:hypothetical protein n=1 Tax=Rhodovulum sp. ES.010 TaxID=1882821 RepID=UPI00092BFDB4|nr:hypothetical protein [Rhodovulum sp. ES.010]SIO43733.1 hypothetical protein SAMN05444722_2145 [Rhodovulum sp. ES.010]
MTRTFRLIAGLGALAALSACVETTGGSAAQMPVAPGSPAFITGMSPDVSQAAINSCRSALASQTTGGVTVVGSEFSQANSAVYMRVGANGAPWRCLVSNDGRGPDLMFMGSEGFL